MNCLKLMVMLMLTLLNDQHKLLLIEKSMLMLMLMLMLTVDTDNHKL